MNYNKMEKKWQRIWEKTNAFKTTDKYEKKFYALDMFPYPSGTGLHVGHPEGYTATDIISRYKRLNQYDVLHPIGWDAFGLPAEQYAIKTGNHPEKFTLENIANFRKQLKSIGFSFDYSKEVNTTDPNYYKWTQWIFVQMYKKGLAELKETEVNWCEELKTVLSNEEVLEEENGNKVSERGSFIVTKKVMKQWVLKITEYADKMLDGLNSLDWPSSLKSLQVNWIGCKKVNGKIVYNLRDWIFARQRYWGEPFPIYFDEAQNIYLVEDLVELPHMDEIKPSGNGQSPLANNEKWVNFSKDGKNYQRDTNTMPQWAGSCWYYLGYILKQEDGTYLDLNSKEAFAEFEKWLPVDLYIGGQEHAVLHLLYARFWHHFLYDIGIVPTKEPFLKVVNQGMILGADNLKMSKSKGNVINPDDIIEEYGADSLRLYEMFMGPLTDTKSWSDKTISSIRKWLERVERIINLFINNKKSFYSKVSKDFDSTWHSFLKDVTLNIKYLKFNIAISNMMVFINYLYKTDSIPSKDILRDLLIVLSTFAPHFSEELLEKLSYKQIMHQTWPLYNEGKIKVAAITIAIKINGKLRSTLDLDSSWNEDEIFVKASEIENVKKYTVGKKIFKKIYIKNKILNIFIE